MALPSILSTVVLGREMVEMLPKLWFMEDFHHFLHPNPIPKILWWKLEFRVGKTGENLGNQGLGWGKIGENFGNRVLGGGNDEN